MAKPGLIVLHGGGRASQHYQALADALAPRFRVVRTDRAGRNQTLDLMLADVAEAMRANEADLLFGHSAGGVVALEAARRLPVRKLAVYEPPLLGEGLVPVDWVPEFEAALRAGREPLAMVLLIRGLQLGIPRWMPAWVAALPVSLVLSLGFRSAEGREMATLMHTLPPEIAALRAIRAQGCAEIRCPTLLLSGDQSPFHLRESARRIAHLVPDATHQVLAAQGHNAPDITAPAEVARLLEAFFATC